MCYRYTSGSVMSAGDRAEEKETVYSAEIIVTRSDDKPYYEIKYQTLDEDFHFGYGSYSLDTVLGYIKRYFTIVKKPMTTYTNFDFIKDHFDKEMLLELMICGCIGHFHICGYLPKNGCKKGTRNCEKCYLEFINEKMTEKSKKSSEMRIKEQRERWK